VARYEEALAIAREMGYTRNVAAALLNLGNAHQDAGALDEAMARFRESLALYVELEDGQGAARCLQGMAMVATARGEMERAAWLCGVTAARAALGEARFATVWASGAARSLHEAGAEVLSGPG
jgi:tetratricopeptide (TPR) repeat protein